MLPATWQCGESRLYPQPKQVLGLATPEGCKAELTYVTWRRTGRELNPWPVNHQSNALPLSYHARSLSRRCRLKFAVCLAEPFIFEPAAEHCEYLWHVANSCTVAGIAFQVAGPETSKLCLPVWYGVGIDNTEELLPLLPNPNALLPSAKACRQ